jgi:hypothetical protein
MTQRGDWSFELGIVLLVAGLLLAWDAWKSPGRGYMFGKGGGRIYRDRSPSAFQFGLVMQFAVGLGMSVMAVLMMVHVI